MHWICTRVRAIHLQMRSGQWVTWNAFALDGFCNDGSGLMAWLAQSLAKLFHAVSVHNYSMPTTHIHTHQSHTLKSTCTEGMNTDLADFCKMLFVLPSLSTYSFSTAHTHSRVHTHIKQPLLLWDFQFYALLPKSFKAFLIFLHVMLQGSRVTLAQAVDVHDSHQVVKLVVGGKRHGLPDSSLRHLAIPQQAVHTVTEVENRVRL